MNKTIDHTMTEVTALRAEAAQIDELKRRHDARLREILARFDEIAKEWGVTLPPVEIPED